MYKIFTWVYISNFKNKPPTEFSKDIILKFKEAVKMIVRCDQGELSTYTLYGCMYSFLPIKYNYSSSFPYWNISALIWFYIGPSFHAILDQCLDGHD